MDVGNFNGARYSNPLVKSSCKFARGRERNRQLVGYLLIETVFKIVKTLLN